MEKNVKFLGALNFSELPSYYSLADLFINFTKRQNGYDLTMLQALACECPVVASQIGSHPTVIPNKNFGALLPWDKPENLTQFIADFLDGKIHFNPKLARTETIKKFNIDTMVDEYIKLYQGLCR